VTAKNLKHEIPHKMIRVPLQSQGEEKKFVEVREASLPKEAAVIVDLLTREQASIEYWLEIAVSNRPLS